MKKTALFLFIPNIFCCIYFLLLAFYNRPALDDYCVMSVYHDYGFFDSVEKWYVHWQARFSAHLLNNLILKSYELTGTLFHFTLLMYVGFIAAFYRLAKLLLSLWKEEKFLLLNISALLFHLFVLFNFDFSTFYWVNVSTMYFGGILAACFLVAEIFSNSKTVFSWLLIFVCCVYAGSSAENFAFILLLLLLFATFYFFSKKDKRFSKSLFAVAIILTAFSLMIFAPGTEARRSLFPAPTLENTLIVSLKNVLTISQTVLEGKWVFLVLMIFVSIALGLHYPGEKIKLKAKKLLGFIFLFCLFLWIALLPVSYAMNEPGPLRAHTHIAFYIIVFVASLSFSLGRIIPATSEKKTDFTLGSCIIVLFIICFKLIKDIPTARDCTNREDKKISLMLTEKQKGRKETLVIKEPDYENLVLKSNTLSNDTAFFANQCLYKALNLGFPVKTE